MFKAILWGTGEKAKRYMDECYHRMRSYVCIVAFIDNNEKRRKEKFYDCPVISYEQTQEFDFDYIVIMNQFAKEIYKQIGKEFENDKVVISCSQFIELFINSGYWKDKSVLFYGDYLGYELSEYRGRFTFKNIQYARADEAAHTSDYDHVFLCPPRTMGPQERAEYETILRDTQIGLGIRDENILRYDEWLFYLKCDREINGGNKNADKRFFVILPPEHMVGWGNILLSVWGGVAYAHAHQMIPVVDMKNMKSQYLSEKLLGKHNAWEDYFEPINEYSLEEVYESRHVVLNGVYSHMYGPMEVESTVYKPDVMNKMENTYRKLFPKEEKVLGVIYRGTDYYTVYGHNITGNLDEYIQYIKEYMKQINYNYIFLATEVEDAICEFEKAFGKRVFWVEQERFPASERRWLYSIHFERENDELKKGMEYLTVLELLSRCDSIVGTYTGAMRTVLTLNQGKYEYVNIMDRQV